MLVLAAVPPGRRPARLALLFGGLVLYGVSDGLLVLAGLGLDPWDVLHQGLSRTLGLQVGTWAIVVGALVLLGWIPLRQRPGLGTVCNVVVIGLVINATLAVVPAPHRLALRIALLVGAVGLNGIATGAYIGAGLGAGPRDGLSTGIAARGVSLRVVRTVVEVCVLVLGWLLGGTVGVGTLLYAVAIGPITHVTIPAFALGARRRDRAPDSGDGAAVPSTEPVIQPPPGKALPVLLETTMAPATTPVYDALSLALAAHDLADLTAFTTGVDIGERDRLLTLQTIYDLHTAPLEVVGDAALHQHHPAVAALKLRCERDWLQDLEREPVPGDLDAGDAVGSMRALAARDRLPAVYKWLAREASWDQVVAFLTMEGGPDAGFDDLVATCQIGLRGAAKMELATNYWDEMGGGAAVAVHSVLQERLAAAIEMRTVARGDMPTAALARTAFGGLLATNRWLQPEMLGALGLIELQAGPRCRLVLQAFDRLGAPPEAYPYYQVHAEVDPRHGKDWLDNVIAPTVREHPELSARIVRGAHWRSLVNAAFLAEAQAFSS